MITKQFIDQAKEGFKKAVKHLHHELSQVQVGRANPAIIENLPVDAYGTMSPLKNNAQITVPDAQSLAIQPWDRSLLSAIEKAIRNSDLQLNPVNDGTGLIRLNIPPLTGERRKDLVKVINNKSEEAKVYVRNVRHEALNHIRSLDGISEDVIKNAETDLQNDVKKTNQEIDQIIKEKENEIMKI